MAGGRRGRCALPHAGPGPDGAPRQAGRGREPSGSGLGDRDCRRRQGCAGWIHAGDGRQRVARDRRHALQVDPLRSDQGFRSDRADRSDSIRACGQSILAGAFGGRARQICQGQSRQAVLRIGRARLAASSLRRTAQEHDRHRDDAHSLQGQRAGPHRCHRRTYSVDVLRHRSRRCR